MFNCFHCFRPKLIRPSVGFDYVRTFPGPEFVLEFRFSTFYFSILQRDRVDDCALLFYVVNALERLADKWCRIHWSALLICSAVGFYVPDLNYFNTRSEMLLHPAGVVSLHKFSSFGLTLFANTDYFCTTHWRRTSSTPELCLLALLSSGYFFV